MKASAIIFLMVILIPNGVSAQAPQLLIIYGSENEKIAITNLLEDSNEAKFVQIDFLTVNDINQANLIILVASQEFSMEDTLEIELQNFISTNQIIIITPYLDEFSGSLRTALGIDSIDDVDEEYNDEFWTIELDVDMDNYKIGDKFRSQGPIGLIELINPDSVIASYTDTTATDGDDLDFPYPAIWNVSNVLGSPSTLVPFESQVLGLSQLPDFFETLLREVLQNVLQNQGISINSENGVPSDENENQFSGLTFDNPLLALYAVIAALFLITVVKFKSIVNWFSHRFLGITIFIMGALFHVQDRDLSHNAVLMNVARGDITDYLDHMGVFGAHLREIKSITKLGSGSLMWHLQVLEDFNMIYKIKLNGYTVYFTAENISDADFNFKEIELRLQSKYAQEIFKYLKGSFGEIDLRDLENETGINRRTLRRFANKMQDENIVTLSKTPGIVMTIKNRSLFDKLYKSSKLRTDYWKETQLPEIEIA